MSNYSVNLLLLYIFFIFINEILSDIVIFKDGYNYHCVGNPVNESALIWMNKEDEIIPNNKNMEKGYICQINKNRRCIKDMFLPGSVFQNSLNYPAGFVLDERWEDFEEIHTDYLSKHNLLNITSNTFTFSFSLRVRDNGYLYICDKRLPWKANNCYFFVFNGWNNNTIGLRRCFTGEVNQNVRNAYPKGNCSPIQKEYSHPTIVSKLEWNHFRIDIHDGEISLYHYGDLSPLFTFYDDNPFEPKFVMIRSKEEGFWKLHDYNFLTLNTKSISKEFKVSSQLCVKVYVKACLNCIITLEIRNDTIVFAQRTVIQGNDWQTIVLRSDKNFRNIPLKLIISVENFKNDPYLIGDIIDCSSTDVHYIATTDYRTCCHSVKQGIKLCLNALNPSPTNDAIEDNSCPTNTFGNTCISCDVFKNCKNSEQYCEILPNKSTRCSCYDGYEGYYCRNPCGKGYYGRRCKQQCYSTCLDCDKISGVCTVCKTPYLSPETNCTMPYYPFLINPPEIISIGYTSANIRIDFNYTGLYPPVYYEIHLKEGEYSNRWYLIEKLPIPSDIITKTIPNLLPGKTYQIKIILIPKNNYYYEYDELLKILRFTTTCREISKNDISFSVRGTSIVSFLRTNSESCSLENLMIKCDNYEIPLRNSTECLLAKCQEVTLTVYNSKRELFVYKAKTGDDTRLQCLSSTETDTSASIHWDNDPSITSYTVEYQFLNSIYKCISTPIKNQIKINEPKVELNNLRPYSKYDVHVSTESTLLRTIPITTQSTKTINQEEFTDLSFSQVDKTLDIMSSVNCNYINGPFNITITVQCISSWCANETNVKEGSFVDMTEQHFTFIIMGFSEYIITRRISRWDSVDIKQYTYISKATGPGPVLDLEIYSKTDTSLSIRFKPPYPPMGNLNSYKIKYYYWSYYPTDIIVNENEAHCKLWDNYHCFEINKLGRNSEYTVEIIPVNEPNLSGEPKTIQGTTQEEISEPPDFLLLSWDENYTSLRGEFPHPMRTNGPLKAFLVYYNKEKGDEIKIDKEQRLYSFRVNHWKSATNLTIAIKVVNRKGLSDPVSNFTFTPPPIPHLNKENIHIIPNLTNVTLQLPEIEIREDIPSFMAVIVTKLSSTSHLALDSFSIVDRKIIEESKISQNYISWVALKRNILKSEKETLYIGDDSGSNRPLLPNTEYNITIFIKNTYQDKTTYFIWGKNITTLDSEDSNFNLLPLLILLIIPGLCGVFFYLRSRGIRLNIPKLNYRREINRNSLSIENEMAQPLQPIKLKPKPAIYQNVEEVLEENEFSKPIRVSDLESYVKECLVNGEFERQHGLFPRGQTKPWAFGTKPENKSKNRYVNLAAYDHSRVRLDIINSDPNSEYINANYIDGYNCNKGFIATQGPKVNTLNDFWRMIWQEQVEYIIMIANLIEGGKKKVAKYWPDINETLTFGDVSVKYMNTTVFANHVERIFNVHSQEKYRTVKQFHFTSWPDHGVPMYAQSLAPFLKKILTLPQDTAPIVVHCSAGVGRTGTLILADICLRMAAKQGFVDILFHQHKLREQRPNMVDNVEQYKLVHLLLLHCLIAPETGIICTENMNIIVEEILASKEVVNQMKYLEDSSWQEEAMHTTASKVNLPIIHEKNRFMNITPDGYSRIILTAYPPTDESSMYINAIKVNGFQASGKFVVTQYPLKNTLGDFWRLVVEQELTVIVCLNELPLNDEASPIFYPTSNDTFSPVPFLNINVISVEESDIFNIYVLSLENLKNKDNPIRITIIQFQKWKYEQICPENPALLVSLFEEMNKLGKQAERILICCYDGVRASGLYTSLCFLIDKIKLEQICDVCLAVRTVRYSRKEFVREMEQFRFLYLCGLEYVKTFEMYSNFRL